MEVKFNSELRVSVSVDLLSVDVCVLVRQRVRKYC